MHALVIKAVPTIPLALLGVALAVFHPGVVENVMLGWHIEDSVGAHTFQALLERVELILF